MRIILKFILLSALGISTSQANDTTELANTLSTSTLFSVQKDIVFKTIENRDIKLDLYRPKASSDKPYKLLIWIHGGAWKRGSKDALPNKNPLLLNSVINAGYALASVNYRLSTEATFPAPVADINDAINYLQANATQYQITADNVVMMGRSAGGHLAGLIGATNTSANVDFYEKPRYQVSAVVSFFGPTDMIQLGNKPARKSNNGSGKKAATKSSKKSSVARFLGDIPKNVPDIAKQASTTSYINMKTPPFIMLHGTLDKQVPLSQSEMLKTLLDEQGVLNQLYIEEGVGHSAPVFDTDKYVPHVMDFLQQHFPIVVK
ncbi:alpha/beta hydrolase [Shewanella sp. TC10]|uniref:alpha/beta hydrolase n=1 Tax=Shewanella sp. TC10 TaxID=1419739 RepID=UPI00129D7E28|nr:alpha/beta hydrolase [Shewanella sp. TC10]